MPCPYFEPRQVAAQPTLPNARLPLIDEYDGICRAKSDEIAVGADVRLRLCNHGNVHGVCAHFPLEQTRSCFRFAVVSRSAAQLDLLFIEEAFYAPLAWRRLTFTIENEELAPPREDPCERAQVLAFCRSYVRRHPQ